MLNRSSDHLARCYCSCTARTDLAPSNGVTGSTSRTHDSDRTGGPSPQWPDTVLSDIYL